MRKHFSKALVLIFATVVSISMVSYASSSDNAITGVSSIGFVDVDGAKVSAIAVEYDMDMADAELSADAYSLTLNNVTDVTDIYVNDEPAISETGGSGSGNYVIIEVDTDYLMDSEQSFESAMSVGVQQIQDIQVGDMTIAASDEIVCNYTESTNERGDEINVAEYGTYTISGIEGFKYYTNVDAYGGSDGPAFHADHCFNEQDGLFYDEDLSYALYVPEDYDPNGSYALITLENPAAEEGTHPFQSVLETRGPSVLASEWAQNLVKENHGLDGMIVVVPTVTERVNDNACTPAQYEALVRLWDSLLEEYSIDENYIYGIGQSVGGMVLMETNRNRDNFFAGILMYENQWAQNYYKDTLFIRNMASEPDTAATAGMHYPRTSSYITYDYYYDTDGNPVYDDHDPYNLYYLISDDNIMVMNRSSNNLSNDTWRELSYLYSDLTGYELNQFLVDANAEISDQEAAISEYLSSENATPDGTEMGLRWVTFEDGFNGYSARKVSNGYEWLLSQSREDEMSREKLDINKPFELADEQDTSSDRETHFTDTEENIIYYKTAKEGAGTQFYNTVWLNLSTIADAEPGWLPEGMSWDVGVEGSDIVSVTPINDDDGKLEAVAVEYSEDMENLVIRLKGDEIIGLDGNVREDITIVMDPFDIYDASGDQIECTTTNAYVNDSAEIVEGAERGSGSGNYVIIELSTDSDATEIGIVQRTTLRTDKVIANALSTRHFNY